MIAPVLETERLVLRPHARGDLADSAAMWGDPDVVRYIGGVPFTEHDCWVRILRHAGSWAICGFGYWVVRERATDRFVGEVGLAELRRPIKPALDAPEMGWVLAPWAHGRGFATEAVGAALAWSDRALGPRTTCIIDADNAASFRVAAKHGYREVARANYLLTLTVILDRG